MSSGLNADIVKTELDELFMAEYDYEQFPQVGRVTDPELFRQEGTQLAAVITEEHGGPGAFEEVAEMEESPEATIRSANQQTFTIAEFAKDTPIPRTYYDDQHWGTIDRLMTMTGMRGRTTQDKRGFDIYAGGFDNHTTNDGLYVWSASHVNLNGDTIDNLETGAFTTDNFETLVRKLGEQKAQDGEAGVHNPVAALFPPILFPDAVEVLSAKAELKPHVTDNTINFFSEIYPGLAVFQSIFVGGSYHSYTNANTAHYLTGRSHSISRFLRESLWTDLIHWRFDAKRRWIHRAGYREEYGAISWEAAVASTGAA